MHLPTVCLSVIGLLLVWPRLSHAHGRLWEPPARSTMWRRGFNTPIQYNDNELFCGGFARQVRNGYRCGVCGDPWDGPRQNEAGGRFATGQISRTYRQGQTVTLQVDLTANHKGYFEFKLCPVNNPRVKATQACLDLHPLTLAGGSGTRYQVTSAMGNTRMSIAAVLPSSVTCDQCVLQWRYHTGNSWGRDYATGQECVGCGQQEEFYGCADIRILPSGSVFRQSSSGSSGSSPRAPTDTKVKVVYPVTTKTAASRPKPTGSGIPATGSSIGTLVCRGVSSDRFDQWCQLNCQGGFCPASHCACVEKQSAYSGRSAEATTTVKSVGCRAVGGYAGMESYDTWCKLNCERGYCPAGFCICG